MSAVEHVETAVASSLPEWHQIVSESFVPLDVSQSVRGDFRGRIRSRALDDIALCEVTASGHNVLRTPELIARNDRMYFKLSLQLSGTGLLIQDDREAVMRPGDLAVYDTHRPYTLAFEEHFRSLVMMFPHDLIDLPVDAVGQLTAVRLAGDEGLGKVISPFLSGLSANLQQLNGPSGRRLSLNALDLVTTMFANELAMNRQDATDPNKDLLGRIRTFIDAHLADPELSPSTIAAAHYISTRHLHNIFQDSGTTVAAWIRSRRLEHCRRDLRDPVCAGRPVAAIAARWGFFDAAHFSRVFKAAFGESPSAYRSAA